ncbi:uncharacterized protein LOC107222728 [Neodiprion lecontei]|uniref:Uncharacterized protein LOC107222728 n=1 Tax=Neodiprion lecontei TaxID=441921 RepID=A0ABM3FLB4_NEOLC|nr:uncharacterized protein LOC107222728 [Neodiprion lecontei]XP_046588816.1 uncharacterized protein LOC107222728 [Neodiprion lecontei]XP_046588817.1 uncharacterized protein LOC107222728 [Neodiprion lecontei]XP_046588818.1 uncharacterized protein LOC107222728 [Neodiprion lecontei]XP_046588819.1 uncharacterized protein LOC107222728 [Neodiprion lecontei]
MDPMKFLLMSATIFGLYSTDNGCVAILTNSVNRCDAPPCRCDVFARLTCDCDNEPEELVLTTEGDRRLSPHTTRIMISNCPSVRLVNSSLTSMGGLRAISFENIGNLTLYPQSFELATRDTPAKISITNSSIDLLPSFTFKGDVEVIHLQNVRIGQVNAFAFSNLVGTETMTLDNCVIDTMEAQAFKKFDVGYLHVIGGTFGDVVPSRAMNDIEVTSKFMLDGVRMGTVRSSAFIIRRPRTVAIQNCDFGTIEGQAFSVTTTGAVIMKNNTFGNLNVGAFLDIKTDPEYQSYHNNNNNNNGRLNDLIFKNNSIKTFEEGSVMFDRGSFRPELDGILVNHNCECSAIPVWRGNVLNYSNVYAKFYSMSVPDEPINVGPETFLCLDFDADFTPVTFNEYEARYCSISNSTLLFVLVLVGSIVVLLVGGFLIVWCCRRQRENNQKRWISVPTNAPDVVSKKNGVIARDAPVDSRITMVVPDGRVYRETEFHVIVEKAEPLTTEL